MPEFALDSATWRRLRPGGYLAIIAAVIIAAMLASNVNDSAHAAEKPPTVTWTRTVTNVAGRDMCKYNATVTTTPGQASKGMVQAASNFLAVDFERPSDGTIVLHSKVFVCAAAGDGAAPSPGPAGSPTPGPAGSPTPGPAGSPKPASDSATNLEPAGWSQPATGTDVKVTPVSFADIRADAAHSRLGQWILGVAIGVLVAGVIAVAGPAVLTAAANAVGVFLSAEVATLAAACLGGATGGAIGEYIKGNTKPQIATSAVVGCAGGTFVAAFKGVAQAESIMEEVAHRMAEMGASSTQSSARIAVDAATQLAELAPAATTVGEATQPLSNSVGTALRRSTSW